MPRTGELHITTTVVTCALWDSTLPHTSLGACTPDTRSRHHPLTFDTIEPSSIGVKIYAASAPALAGHGCSWIAGLPSDGIVPDTAAHNCVPGTLYWPAPVYAFVCVKANMNVAPGVAQSSDCREAPADGGEQAANARPGSATRRTNAECIGGVMDATSTFLKGFNLKQTFK